LQLKIIKSSFVLSGVFAMADWMDGEVDVPEQKLSNGQIFALLRMTTTLQENNVMGTVVVIRDSIESGDLSYAQQLWGELSEPEQTALWVAPKFGGIFTTKERSIIKGGFKDE
jgi:hypothetical protein